MVPGLNPGVASFGVKHSHMRVWYSNVFVHRPKDLGAKKLGERGHHMKFLGYPHNSSGYRTYDPVTHKVEVVWCRQDNSLLWDPPTESSFMGQIISSGLHHFRLFFLHTKLSKDISGTGNLDFQK